MQANRNEKMEAFGRLLDIMDDLRSQCPWDKKQTTHTLRILTIEETYELADAITQDSWSGIREELGDIMLHMIFYSKIAEEQKQFSIAEVLHAQCEKLIHRHPHIYGDVKVQDEEEVKRNWEALKLKEGKKSVLQGVPQGLPALIKAFRIQDKAAQVNFEWRETAHVWMKVQEEILELQEAAAESDTGKTEEEFGDLLFSLINLARFLKVDPENALERTNQKFIRRFQYIEKQAAAMQRDLNKMSLEEMDALWDEAKKLPAQEGE